MLRRPQAITVNFAGVDHRRVAAVRRVLTGVIVLLALLAGWMVLQARAAHVQAAAVERLIGELAAAQEKLRPEMEERRKLLADLSAMSGLLEARKFSWTRFLTDAERAFPAGIALSRVELDPRTRTAVLEGAAQSPEALSSLMIGLQRSDAFRDPLLKHQSMDKGNLSFNVTVQYQPSVAAGQAAGASRRSGD